jgi:hypothetical protein
MEKNKMTNQTLTNYLAQELKSWECANDSEANIGKIVESNPLNHFEIGETTNPVDLLAGIGMYYSISKEEIKSRKGVYEFVKVNKINDWECKN